MNVALGKPSSLWSTFRMFISNPFRYWFENELAPILPRRWKRVLYIASIIAMTSFLDHPDFLLFEKINKILTLPYRGKTLWIPRFMRNIVWGKVIHKHIEIGAKNIPASYIDQHNLSIEEFDTLCEYLIKKTPNWIKYAPDSFIRKDLKRCLNELFTKKFAQTEISA